ncbi:MAG: hypothetical protein R3Y28_06145 [Candidatus Gastranaerophilales bacterium]
MKEQLLRLCKQLGSISIEEVAPILEIDENELEQLLDSMSELSKVGCVYKYVEPNKNKKELPLFFECHTLNEINIIIKAFCSEINEYKIMYLLEKSHPVVYKFNRYFRTTIYETQEQQLLKYFKNNPKVAFERTFFNTKYYFYNYNNKIHVSTKRLYSKNEIKNTKEDTLEFKRVYSYIKRHLIHNTRKYYPQLYLAEAIWRRNKTFNELECELKKLLFSC